MQPHAQRRIALRNANGILHRRFVHHQTRLRQKTRPMSTLDRSIHVHGAAKVVSGKDELFQNTCSPAILSPQSPSRQDR